MKKTISMLFATTLLFATGCDSEETPTEARSAELQAEPEADAPCEDGGPGMHGKHMNPATALCAEIECSDEQVQQITALFAAHEPEHGKRGEGDREAFKAARAEANQKLAAAFVADSFDSSVLDQLHPGPKHEDGDGDARLDEMIDLVTALHGLLTPAQRETLAGKIEEGGPRFMHGGKGRHHAGGKHGRKGPEGERPEGERKIKGHEDRLAKKVERFCEPLSCSDEQQTQLRATFEGAHEDRRGADKPDFKPFADAFRAASIDQAKLRELMLAAHAKGGEHKDGFANVIAEVHDILTPEQRALVAERIAEGGLRAVIGHGKGGEHGKHGKHGKFEGERAAAE